MNKDQVNYWNDFYKKFNLKKPSDFAVFINNYFDYFKNISTYKNNSEIMCKEYYDLFCELDRLQTKPKSNYDTKNKFTFLFEYYFSKTFLYFSKSFNQIKKIAKNFKKVRSSNVK